MVGCFDCFDWLVGLMLGCGWLCWTLVVGWQVGVCFVLGGFASCVNVVLFCVGCFCCLGYCFVCFALSVGLFVVLCFVMGLCVVGEGWFCRFLV